MYCSCVHSLLCYLLVSEFCVFIFFFKQKTAYEMRISDWSSDVCSSDLLDVQRAVDLELCVEAGEPVLPGADRHVVQRREVLDQIGRASCRERVCQYV